MYERIVPLLVCLTIAGCQPTAATPDAEIQEVVSQAVDNGVGVEDPATSVPYEPHPAFEQAWPTSGFNRSDLISTSLYKTFASLDKRSESYDQKDLQIYIQDSIPNEHKPWLEELATKTILTFSKEIEQPIQIIIGSDTEFMEQTVNENDLTMPMIAEKVCYYSYGACSNKNTVWVGAGTSGLSVLDGRIDFSRMLSHKAFHAVQDQLDWAAGGQIPPRDAENFRPVWFVEGLAEFYGAAMNDYVGLHEYKKSQNEWFGYAKLDLLEEWNESHDESKYLWGQVATEYLIANAGFESVVDLYLNLQNGQNFEDAFYSSIGISLNDFYLNFDIWARSYQS